MVSNIAFIFPYIGKNHPNWLSYFSEGLKPPTRCCTSWPHCEHSTNGTYTLPRICLILAHSSVDSIVSQRWSTSKVENYCLVVIQLIQPTWWSQLQVKCRAQQLNIQQSRHLPNCIRLRHVVNSSHTPELLEQFHWWSIIVLFHQEIQKVPEYGFKVDPWDKAWTCCLVTLPV